MNIAFFGTSDKSKPILEILSKEFDLKLCVTKTDRKVGRKQTEKPTLVKNWALDKEIPAFEINEFRDREKALLKELVSRSIDLIVVADFGFIITKDILDAFEGKIINIHFSLLPKYRGANPVQAAILNGDEVTGISYILMEEGLDKGKILHQVEFPLEGNETTGELYEDLFSISAEILPKVINEYTQENMVPKEQEPTKASYYYSPTHPKSTYIYKEDARVDWEDAGKIIERKIRAFSPWPIAWSTLGDLEEGSEEKLVEKIKLKNGVNKKQTIKIYRASLAENKILPEEIQIEGKKRIFWDAFLNGYCVKK